MRGASSRCGCHRYRHPSSPPPPRRTSERRTNRALECGFPREEECEGHQQGGNRRDRTRAYATTLKMPRGLLAGLPRGLRERAQPECCPLPLPPLPLEAGLLGQHLRCWCWPPRVENTNTAKIPRAKYTQKYVQKIHGPKWVLYPASLYVLRGCRVVLGKTRPRH